MVNPQDLQRVIKKWYQWGTCGHISNADIIDDKDYNATLLNGFNSTNHM